MKKFNLPLVLIFLLPVLMVGFGVLYPLIQEWEAEQEQARQLKMEFQNAAAEQQRKWNEAEAFLKITQEEHEKAKQKQELETLIDSRIKTQLNSSRCYVVGQTVTCY